MDRSEFFIDGRWVPPRDGIVIDHYDLDIDAPFGGVKASGIGRELGPEGLHPYLVYKSIYLASAGAGKTNGSK